MPDIFWGHGTVDVSNNFGWITFLTPSMNHVGNSWTCTWWMSGALSTQPWLLLLPQSYWVLLPTVSYVHHLTAVYVGSVYLTSASRDLISLLSCSTSSRIWACSSFSFLHSSAAGSHHHVTLRLDRTLHGYLAHRQHYHTNRFLFHPQHCKSCEPCHVSQSSSNGDHLGIVGKDFLWPSCHSTNKVQAAKGASPKSIISNFLLF